MLNSSRSCLLALAALLLLSAPLARADIIVFTDGRTLEGEVIGEEDGFYIVKGRFGTTRIPKNQVREILKVKSKRQVFEAREKTLAAGGQKDDAGEWLKLARFADKQRLLKEAQRAYRKVVALEPDQKEARKALGQVRYLGRWVPLEEKMKKEGKVKVGKRWVTKEEAEALKKKTDLVTPPLAGKPQTPVKSVLQPCPVCGGSGVRKWIACLQCKRSGKPGYLNMGERMEICRKCRGTGKVPGIYCERCRGTGKIDPSKPITASGKRIPKGYRACGACGGTGVEHWIKCNQCARSDEPGYLFMGNYYKRCNRCKGKGKLPGILCKACKGKGIVKE